MCEMGTAMKICILEGPGKGVCPVYGDVKLYFPN